MSLREKPNPNGLNLEKKLIPHGFSLKKELDSRELIYMMDHILPTPVGI